MEHKTLKFAVLIMSISIVYMVIQGFRMHYKYWYEPTTAAIRFEYFKYPSILAIIGVIIFIYAEKHDK